jgi:hypothetical protein
VEVGANEADILHAHAELYRFPRDLVADAAHDRRAPIGQQRRERHLAERIAQRRVDHRAEALAERRFGLDRLEELQRIDDAVADIGVDHHAALVAQRHFLGVGVEVQQALVEEHHVLPGLLPLQAGSLDDALRIAELDDERLLALVDDEKARVDDGPEGADRGDEGGGDAGLHGRAPAGCPGCACGAAGRRIISCSGRKGTTPD